MIKLSKIKSNPDNPRVIRDEKFKKLCDSLIEFPKMMELRPIVVDENNMILGGNMRLRALQHLEYKEVPDTWVKRADELTDDEKQRFIITDNAGFGEWDFDILANQFDAEELSNWGVDVPVFSVGGDDNPDIVTGGDKYTNKITAPIYEPKGEKPSVKALYDDSKVNKLLEDIYNSSIPEDIKQFLINAAQRHRVFNYSLVADFYAHSDKEVQTLMENSALVIIDFNKAIENGYVKLTDEIRANYHSEVGDDEIL